MGIPIMRLKFLVVLLFIAMCAFSDSYGIVRRDDVDDSLYLELGSQFESVIKVETETSFGSGVLIDSNTIITSAHNIKHKKNIRVIINYVEYVPNKIIYHKDLDLAILKIQNLYAANAKLELYNGQYINETFIIVGYGFTGTGSKGHVVRDFKKRGAKVTCSSLNKGFGECLFVKDDGLDTAGCVAPGDSGGGLFKDKELAGIITYVTGKGGDGKGDSTYGDKSAFIPINLAEDWILENL